MLQFTSNPTNEQETSLYDEINDYNTNIKYYKLTLLLINIIARQKLK